MFKMILQFIALALCVVGSLAVPTPNVDSGLRIIGGSKVAAIDDHPYMVALYYKDRFVCGGVIIHERLVATAAHCVHIYGGPEDPTKFKIAAGTTVLIPGTTFAKVIHIQEGFKPEITPPEKPNEMINDIALLEFEDPITTAPIARIELVDTDVEEADDVTFVGWGSLKPTGDISKDLHEVGLKVMKQEDCISQYDNKTIIPKQICTSTTEKKGFCYRDSGGPLIKKGATVPEHKLVGIASWGIPCARGKPDVFTRVFSYLKWIQDIIATLPVIPPPGP